MGNVKVKEAVNIEKLRINELSNIDAFRIAEIRNVAPVAVHIKELNQLDPISVESLRIREISNLEPISIEKFNITSLPTVNLSLRQLPAVDMNVRRLPPVSVGFHQNFSIPSNYVLRARVLGFELFRLHLDGQTSLIPREKYRREESRSPEKSYPEVATAGNPAIPSHHIEEGHQVFYRHLPGKKGPAGGSGRRGAGKGSIRAGLPGQHFGTAPGGRRNGPSGGNVSGGGE